MGFQIVSGSPQTVWVPVINTDTLYVGQLVTAQSNEGLTPMGQASGAADTSAKTVPFGIVIGTNLRTPAFNGTYNTDSITYASPLANTKEYVGASTGPWKGGDRFNTAMAEVALIDPHTIIRGSLYNSTVGTAPAVGTETTGDANGLTFTSDTAFGTGVDSLCTLYYRSGANQGQYRITDDTSTTTITHDIPTFAAIAVGDTAVRVPLRYAGPSYVQFDTESLFIDTSATPSTNYYIINVVNLDLEEAGREYVEFQFGADHFALARA